MKEKKIIKQKNYVIPLKEEERFQIRKNKIETYRRKHNTQYSSGDYKIQKIIL